MAKITHPYELLVRWNADTGVLQGAHFRTITTHIDDDTAEVLARKESPAISVAIGKETGHPLGEVLSTALIDALSALEAKTAEVEVVKASLEATVKAAEELALTTNNSK